MIRVTSSIFHTSGGGEGYRLRGVPEALHIMDSKLQHPKLPLIAGLEIIGTVVNPKALLDIDKGGTVICGGIHMSDIPSFPYEILWEERTLRSIANLTRKDASEFLTLASKVKIKTQTTLYDLEQANEAIADLRRGSIQGAVVLVI